ncbi:MAG TPA: WYL domain-containing protein [Holophagaceae bacterium]
MAVTKTPRKKTEAAKTPEASQAPKAPAKKASKKETPAKPATRKVTGKKAAQAELAPAPKATRKTPRATPPPEPPAPVEAPAEATPVKAAPKKPAVAAEPRTLPPFADAVLSAIREGRALEFIFTDGDANAPRTFEPRQLAFDALSQAWYVWGWDRRYNAERHHRLDLLAEINPVEGVGRAAQGPYPEGTPANQIGGWLGGEPIAVKATLMKQWVFAVKQAPPAFPHFKLEEQGDGQALVTFSATDLRAIARWVLQFGDGIQVLEPARLLDRLRQVAAVWAGRDRQVPAATPRQEPPRAEARPTPKPEPQPEPRRPENRPPAREGRPREADEESPRSKSGKVEIIRFDRL